MYAMNLFYLLMDHFAAKVGRIDLKIGKLELSLD
jgi:hypothetical protein